MKKAQNEAVIIARHLNAFLNEYVPSQKSRSSQTLKSYRDALALYIGFLETEKEIRTENLGGACFSRTLIEEWLQWLMTQRGCSPETCNNRLASLRAFMKYLGMKDAKQFTHLRANGCTCLRTPQEFLEKKRYARKYKE